MNVSRRIRSAISAAVTGAILAAGLGWVLHAFKLGQGLRHASYDMLLVARGNRPVNEAVLVYLDELSHTELHQPLNAPWDRALHAQLIDRLTRAGARAIVFDVVFSDANPDKAAADARLVEAVKSSGRVILAADNEPIGGGNHRFRRPFDALLDVAASVGSAELRPDSDLTVRQHTPENEEQALIPLLSWATAEFVGAASIKEPGLRFAPRYVNYYGRPGIVPSVSYYQALDPQRLPDEFFRDKIVFVGARLLTKFAADRKDEFQSPYSLWMSASGSGDQVAPFLAGVELQATLALNLVRGDWLRRLSGPAELAVLLLCGVLLGAGLIWLRPFAAGAASAAFAAAALALCYGCFVSVRFWFPWMIVMVELVVALSWSILFNFVQLYVQKVMWEQTIARYLSPKLVKKFAGNPAFLKPGAEEQEATFLFSDIADFTSISQELSPDELAAMMNQYFESAVSGGVHPTDGTVVKYIGDAIFALWNAPDAQADHAARACDAALRFRHLPVQEVRGRRILTRIGIHTGLAKVGNFGSEERFDYTALGENVNLASRLEGLNKLVGTQCLISRPTRDRAGAQCVTRLLGWFQVKGFDRAVEVFELVGWAEEAESTRPWRESFARALEAFEQRRLEEAESLFQETLVLHPGDGAARFYLQRLKELRAEPPTGEWATHTVVREK